MRRITTPVASSPLLPQTSRVNSLKEAKRPEPLPTTHWPLWRLWVFCVERQANASPGCGNPSSGHLANPYKTGQSPGQLCRTSQSPGKSFLFFTPVETGSKQSFVLEETQVSVLVMWKKEKLPTSNFGQRGGLDRGTHAGVGNNLHKVRVVIYVLFGGKMRTATQETCFR